MTIPKKGRRTIIVKDNTYYYKTRAEWDRWDSSEGTLKVIIENPEGKVNVFSVPMKHGDAFTPKNVSHLIETEGI